MLTFLLEDDPAHAAHFISSMASTHIDVTHFARPKEFFSALTDAKPNLIVLDWMLPDLNGYQVLRRVRELLGRSTPVIMLTCVDNEEMIVNALAAGADDFLVKPIPQAVLRARLEAFARRIGPAAATSAKAVEIGPFQLDFVRQSASVAGVPVILTPKEFDVAWVLMNNPDRFISKSELIASVWGKSGEIAAHTIAQHMHAIRKKFRLAEHRARLVAIYGSGYRFEASSAAAAKPAGEALSELRADAVSELQPEVQTERRGVVVERRRSDLQEGKR